MESDKKKKKSRKSEEHTAKETKEKEESCCCHDCESCHSPSEEVEALKAHVAILEAQMEAMRKEHNDKMLEFVDKKSKEAAQLIADKNEEFADKCKRDFDEKIKYFYSKQLSELVDVVSQFEAVINSVTDPSVSAYLVGFKMFLSQFDSLLSSFHITAFVPSEGEEFDSAIMEATTVKVVEDRELDNKIVKVLRKGYRLYDRVIRLSSVEVGKIKG